MKFPGLKKSSKQHSSNASRKSGEFKAGDYVSTRPKPTTKSERLYRRGTTRTGATKYGIKKLDPSAMSDATPRETIRRLEGIRTKMLLGRWFLVVAGISLFVLSYSFIASVNINLTGAAGMRAIADQERSAYIESIQEYLRNNPIERIGFFLNDEELNRFVSTKNTEVGSVVKLSVSGVGQTTFKVESRKPVASWRNSSGEVSFVDSSGISFKNNLYDSPGINIVDNSGAKSANGKVLISSSFLRFVGRTIAFASERGYSITEVTIPPLSFRQVEFTIDGLSYKTLMTTGRPAGVQVEDMDNAIKYFRSQGRNPTYIDVRVEGVAYFRE